MEDPGFDFVAQGDQAAAAMREVALAQGGALGSFWEALPASMPEDLRSNLAQAFQHLLIAATMQPRLVIEHNPPEDLS